MADLPSGTVTFVFTDIEGSTRLLNKLGDRYADALMEHRRILGREFSSRGGVEVDTQGDALFYAFARASDAVAAAEEAQRALASGPIRVRIGLHTGEPQVTEAGYVGLAVHIGARIAASGHGGQVVLSRRTKELVGDGVVFTDLGDHRLKDLVEPVRLFQLGRTEFPPLRSLSVTNLPEPATSFIGRERELGDAAALLENTRLLTITGAGGTGKTRLAITLAHAQIPGFPDGVFWVPLSSLRDSQLVIRAAEQVVGANNDFARYASDKRMLVLLDNFEQVMGAASDLSRVLSSCPNLSVIVTSRERLRIEGEREFVVPSLTEDEGEALFRERAGLEPSEPIRELCRRLDGLPLAIELAAARAKLFSPEQLLERLSERLDLFKGGRDSDPRHATLRATIEWSYDLLPASERTALDRLSIFADGCTFEAAEEVAQGDADLLQSLLEKSLVRRTGERLWMLETIREYAAERLAQSGDAESIARRHGDYFLALSESANLDQFSEGPGSVYEEVFVERANIRTALDRALQRGDAAFGLRLALAVGMLWNAGNPLEGMGWFAAFLDLEADVPPELHAAALRVHGGIANHAGEDALAESLFEQSLEEYRRLGDDFGIAVVLVHLAHSAWYRGDPETAFTLGTEGLEAGRRLGHEKLEAQALGLLGELEFERGAHGLGIEHMETSAVKAAQADFPWWQARMLMRLVKRARELGRDGDAGRWALESLRVAASMPDHRRIVQVLDLLALMAADDGDLDRAGRLRGAVEAEASREPLSAWSMSALPAEVEASPEFERARRKGTLLSLDAAVDVAFQPQT